MAETVVAVAEVAVAAAPITEKEKETGTVSVGDGKVEDCGSDGGNDDGGGCS
jgi:hypothetical protein